MHSDELVSDVYDASRGYCVHCRKKIAFTNYGTTSARGAWEVDHWVPLARGGTDDPDNLVAACVGCNREKGTMTGEEFRAYLRQFEVRSPPRRRRSRIGQAIGGLAILGLGALALRALFGNRRS